MMSFGIGEDLAFRPAHESTGIHELQHAIQTQEGFAPGGSPSQFRDKTSYNWTRNPQEAARFHGLRASEDYQGELAASNALFAKEFAPRLDALEDQMVSGQLTVDQWDKLTENIMNEFKIRQVAEFPTMAEVERISKKLGPEQTTKTAHEQYQALAGEAEARLAQARLGLTPEERAARPFYKEYDVPIEEQIVSYKPGFGGDPSMQVMSRAEAEAAGLWHPIGDKKKLPMPFSQMTRETVPVEGATYPDAYRANLEAMQGGILLPGHGDRSDFGQYLTKINEVELPDPVLLEGGHGFMRSHAPIGSAWAAKDAEITKLLNKATPGLEKGQDPYLAYIPMTHGTTDFNTMMADAMLEQMKGSDISKTAKGMFDRRLRKLRPEWPGIDAEEAIPMLEKTGALRHAFMDTAQLKDFQKRGFPELAPTRKAITDPTLFDVPVGHGGQSIAKLTGERVTDSPMPHKTYNTQLGGEYIGGIPEGIPQHLLFPDFYGMRREAGKPEGGDFMSLYRSKMPQEMNQEWLDNIMRYLENSPPGGQT
jgi:hypothetical protein